jgi:hypothetical protein
LSDQAKVGQLGRLFNDFNGGIENRYTL